MRIVAFLTSRYDARDAVNHRTRSVTKSVLPRVVMQKRPPVRVISRYTGHLLFHSAASLFFFLILFSPRIPFLPSQSRSTVTSDVLLKST